MVLLAAYHFIEVPIRIAFKLVVYFQGDSQDWGAYVFYNFLLDMLLLVDIFLTMFRSYVNESSATIWDLK